MIVGVPKEIMDHEHRVAMTPEVVGLLVGQGHQVLVQAGAGIGSGHTDADYAQAGAVVASDAIATWGRADLVLKVKEPFPPEYPFLRPGLALFCFLHLAAKPELTRTLLDQGVTAIAFETVQLPDGSLPILAPMSEIAGRAAVQIAAHYLEQPSGGGGKLLGGAAGVPPARVAVVGGGVVGTWAAHVALGMGATVTVLDVSGERLRQLQGVLPGRVYTAFSNPATLAEATREADVLIGALLVPGARAPKLVSAQMVADMRRGSVVLDVAVDQGGCIETTRLTSHSAPIYEINGVIHYCVGNIPGMVPRTSTHALAHTAYPYLEKLVNLGLREALQSDPALAQGVNTYARRLIHPRVAEALELPATPLATLLAGNAGSLPGAA